jgi:hypothetical protein
VERKLRAGLGGASPDETTLILGGPISGVIGGDNNPVLGEIRKVSLS